MSKPINVRAYLEASTVNITQDDDKLLSALADDSNEGRSVDAPSRVIAHEYGYFLNVVGEEEDGADRDALWVKLGASAGLMALFRFAREYDCWWINLDRDAEPVPGLPTFDW